MKNPVVGLVGCALAVGMSVAGAAPSSRLAEAVETYAPSVRFAQARQTCGDMSTCRDAVILWWDGYTRADADDDGIPCETVCNSLEEVDGIRAEIGC